MGTFSNLVAGREALEGELAGAVAGFASFLPHLLAALVLFVVGWAVSWLVAAAAGRLLRVLGLDRLARRHQFAERAGLPLSLSEALASLTFWLLLVIFGLASLHVLGFGAVTATVDRLLAFLPQLLGALLVALLGLLIARFAGRVAGSAAAAAGFSTPRRLGTAVQVLAAGLVAILAIEQLGLSTEVLVGPVTVLLGAFAFSTGLAFALGARPIITHILAGHFLRQSLPRDSFVQVAGERGIVERIGPTDTLFANGDKRWSIPNAQLLDLIVNR